MTSIAELVAAAEPTAPRLLEDLAERLRAEGRLSGEPSATTADLAVRGLAFDSRAVVPGGLFVAVPGEHVDGHTFVGAAAAAGAAAAIVEHPVEVPLPQVVVDRSRAALATAAAWWYGDPSAELGVIGITGTDGKTTTSFLATAALEAAGVPTGMLGTAALEIGDVREPNPEHATTPEAPRLQAILRAMVAAGDRAAIVETTSHGLALERVAGIRYDVALFTNLSHEHLELHGTFEAYRDAKRSLFERLAVSAANPPKPDPGWPRVGIVNANDAAADAFVEATRAAGARVITYSANPGRRPADVISTNNWADGLAGVGLSYAAPSGSGRVRSRLAGAFNVVNLLAVVALGEALGLDLELVGAGLESVDRIPGRMERIVAGQPFEVIVDYAHTPASLQGVLNELRRNAKPRLDALIVVFGSAGERDTQKRPD
ncbi:MAG TPA: UDP-N-acetylmuramyl-tripeptide synthetase, partial [Candidatus Limnocylindrales bacterium]